MPNLFGHCRDGVSSAKSKIRISRGQCQIYLGIAETEYLRRSQRYAFSPIRGLIRRKKASGPFRRPAHLFIDKRKGEDRSPGNRSAGVRIAEPEERIFSKRKTSLLKLKSFHKHNEKDSEKQTRTARSARKKYFPPQKIPSLRCAKRALQSSKRAVSIVFLASKPNETERIVCRNEINPNQPTV